MVRYCLAGKLNIDEYLKKGNNVVKHEFFITAIHDFTEQVILDNFPGVVPSITSKATIDFIYNEVPYDLKISPPLKTWDYESAKKNPELFARSLYEGQDAERIRESAKETDEFNRLFLIYKDDVIWQELEDIQMRIKKLFSMNNKPFLIDVDGKKIKVLVLFLQ